MAYIEPINVTKKGKTKSTRHVFHRNVLDTELLKQIAVIQTPLEGTSNFHRLEQVDAGKEGAQSCVSNGRA
jgi:hypothetical protein